MFTLTLVTPQKKILEGASVQEVYVPAYRGELEILPGHAPLVTTLSVGVLKYKLEGSSRLHAVAISWGYCEVTPEGAVNVMAETAEAPEEIDVQRAEKARSEALAKLADVSYDDFEKFQRKFQRAEARIETVKQKSH